MEGLLTLSCEANTAFAPNWWVTHSFLTTFGLLSSRPCLSPVQLPPIDGVSKFPDSLIFLWPLNVASSAFC